MLSPRCRTVFNVLPNYHAYLIRIWRDTEKTPWRASVTHVETGEVHRFGSPDLAWEYLQARLKAGATEEMPGDPA